MNKSLIVWVAILVIAASTDLCAQFRRENKFRAFDFSRTELATSYAIIGGDEYLMFNATVPVTKSIVVGSRACIRLNQAYATSWSTSFQRIYSSMYYAFSRFEYGIDLSHEMQMTVSASVGAGIADRIDDIPCYWEAAWQPIMLIHPDVSLLMEMTHNFHASVSFAMMHSPTLDAESFMHLPKPLLGFNIRMYPWLEL
jgi:hypothetical protein